MDAPIPGPGAEVICLRCGVEHDHPDIPVPRAHPADADMTIRDAERGIVQANPPRTKVAIVGAGRTRTQAPWNDPSWEVWGLNEIAQPRADRWFELHPLSVQTEAEMAWLRACPKPVYLVRSPPADIPMGVRFPLEEVVKIGLDFFACTFAYQIALAILQQFKTIGLYGVDLPWGTPRERLFESACVHAWVGFAMGAGRRVILPADGALLQHPPLGRITPHPRRYGFDYHEEKDAVAGQVKDFFDLYRRGAFGAVGGDGVVRVD